MLSLLIALAAPALSSSHVPDEFGELWYDGRAEVAGYRWAGERYGEQRVGEAVAIFVTEPFSEDLHVKVDKPSRATGEPVTAVKLNLVRDFQTGIYDYNTMTSVFVRADDFTAMKASFSSAEWCGHVFEELDVRPSATIVDVRSYFQDESGPHRIETKPDGLLGEQLFVWLRGLRGHVLAPGESTTRPYLPEAFERRLRHVAPRWGTLEITRAGETTSVELAGRSYAAITYRLAASDGRAGTVRIAESYPHTLLSWSWQRGEVVLDAGELTGVERLPYWQLHGEGDEALRGKLGLPAR